MNIKKTAVRAAIGVLCLALTAGFIAESLMALAQTASSPAMTNSPPTAKSFELSTFRDVPVTGRFSASDPDGGALTFEIVMPPKRGALTATEDGTFIYSPRERSRGRDSFTYVAVDSAGNVSDPATVSITVRRQSGRTSYADMDGNSAAYAALVLSENGIFTGEMLGDRHFFRPEMPVTRGEFLAMCLKISGRDAIPGVTRTGFYDDESIPMWIKPYVSTALVSGIIRGYRNADGNLVFSPNSPVTFSEAAVMLAGALGMDGYVPAMRSDPYIPVWAYGAAASLHSAGVLRISGIHGDHITRADAAKMLLNSRNLIASGGASLLGWTR